MTWGQAFYANYTDGIVVLQRAASSTERYFGALRPDSQHIAMSVASRSSAPSARCSSPGANRRERQGRTDRARAQDSAFGDATVRQLLDMTTGLKYSELRRPERRNLEPRARRQRAAAPPGYARPDELYEFPATVKKEGNHGEAFAYKTVNTDAPRLSSPAHHQQVGRREPAGAHLEQARCRAGRLLRDRRPGHRKFAGGA